MTKTPTKIKPQNLDQFMDAMARVLGIPRKRLYKIMFQGTRPHPHPRRSAEYSERPTDLVAK
jgi:hypothetical protein